MWPKLLLLAALALAQAPVVNTPTDDVDAILIGRDVKETVLVCVRDATVECMSVKSLRTQLFNRKNAH